MKLYFSPTFFNLIAKKLVGFRWRFLSWSIALLALFVLLQTQLISTTPRPLLLLALFILFMGLQLLILSAFIFFFWQLPSHREGSKKESLNADSKNLLPGISWLKFYRTIEWCEATLFFILLPLPSLTFIYALFIMTGV